MIQETIHEGHIDLAPEEAGFDSGKIQRLNALL